MKKFISIMLILAGMIILPTSGNADTQALNLKDTIEAEKFTFADDTYKETDDQVMIYLFRGDGCSHCYDFLEYLNSIVAEYGYMFKMRSYEIWDNPDNAALQTKVRNFFGETKSGVPYIIIGKSTFRGFGESTGEKILTAIKSEYESEDRYDVFEEMEKGNSNKNNNALYIVVPLACAAIAFIIGYAVKKD